MIRKKDALDYHEQGRHGKIEVIPSKPLLTQRDLSLAYSPGVAEPCLEIQREPELSYRYTARGNLVAVISNGTAVLGLGNIGPDAAKPVMEGKGCLFKKFADIDVFDIEVNATDPAEFIRVVAALEPSFGGINLEDVRAPECFYIEAELRRRMSIPVFHDDQHGTAIISGAALLNACELQKKRLADLDVVVCGAGASAIACANFYVELGVPLEQITLCDTHGVVFAGREAGMNPYKERFAGSRRAARGRRTLAEALDGADVFLGCSKGGLVTAEMVARMAPRPIVFALANPDPEITYDEARRVRPDAIVATGRSDFPNQVNNVLGFPFIFRGALDVRAREINEAMKVAAARALAELAQQDVPESVQAAYGNQSFHFGPEYIIPKPFDPRALLFVAPAVASAAMASGAARRPLDLEAYREQLERLLGPSRELMRRTIIRAQTGPKRVVFPEGDAPKIIQACRILLAEKIAVPVLLGPKAVVEARIREYEPDLAGQLEIVDPETSPEREAYAQRLFEKRQRRGITMVNARERLRRRNYYGAMMVEAGQVDGLVSGLTMDYAETIRPALEIIGVADGVRRAAGMYALVLKRGDVRFFADTTVNIEPDAETLAEIAITSADAVREFELVPRVAMLSFSNFGSTRHPEAERVAEATRLVRQRRPDIEIDGEVQADLACDPEMMREIYPFSALTDYANVFVFPNLAAGNIAYKLMMRLGGAEAIGPILLGMRRPVNVLQRGTTVSSIVHMTALTVVKAQGGRAPVELLSVPPNEAVSVARQAR